MTANRNQIIDGIPKNPAALITTNEAAAMLCISRAALYEGWARWGLRAVRVGGYSGAENSKPRIRFVVGDIQALVRRWQEV